jgi:lipopolysaccharide export system protein LptA
VERAILRRLTLLAFAALAGGPAFAQAASADQPQAGKVAITSDHFVVKDAVHQAVFSGNVVVVQPTVTVHADQVVAQYGAEGASSLSNFKATGHVVLITTEQTATGDVAVFDPKSQLLTLTGNVIVTNKSGEVKSDKLVVDLDRHTSAFTSKSGRITGTFSEEQ